MRCIFHSEHAQITSREKHGTWLDLAPTPCCMRHFYRLDWYQNQRLNLNKMFDGLKCNHVQPYVQMWCVFNSASCWGLFVSSMLASYAKTERYNIYIYNQLELNLNSTNILGGENTRCLTIPKLYSNLLLLLLNHGLASPTAKAWVFCVLRVSLEIYHWWELRNKLMYTNLR